MTPMAPAPRAHLERLRRTWRGSALPAFLTWWGGQLRASLPLRWRRWLQSGAQWLLLLPDHDKTIALQRVGEPAACGYLDTSVAAPLQRQSIATASAGIDDADLRLALCLPASAVLRRTLTLPVAARADLHQVMAWEMDRQTPFRAADVYFDVRTLGSMGHDRISVELLVTPRTHIDPLLADLRQADVRIDAIDVQDGAQRLGANLLPQAQRPSHANPRRRRNLLLLAATLVLLVLAMGQWVHTQRQMLAQMQAEVDALHGQARSVLALRKQVQDRVGAADFLRQRKQHAPAILDLLETITTRLPDGSWLERLSVDAGQLGMRGQSPQATALLKRMQGSPLYGEPSFEGVITADPRSGDERFYMVAPLPAPASSSAAPRNPGGHADARITPR